MAYQVKFKLLSHMVDKTDWASVAEWRAFHEVEAETAAWADVRAGQDRYKSAATVLAVEDGEVFSTVTYNSEADSVSAQTDYQAAREAAGLVRRTYQVVVSTATV